MVGDDACGPAIFDNLAHPGACAGGMLSFPAPWAGAPMFVADSGENRFLFVPEA